jgi:hypothetical protein
MTITYVSVKGGPLTVAEHDGNISDLDGRVTTVETNPPDANGIANVTQPSQSQIRIILDDGTQYTFTLPTAIFAWRGEWAGATVYFENDVVVVTGDGVYLVLQDHTSEATFSAAEANSDGDYYHFMIGAGADGADGANGTNGTNGTDGATWYTGAGEPDPGLGLENDFYFDQGTSDGTGEGDIYQHLGSDGWTLIASTKGTTGDTGAQGPTGAGSNIIVEEGGVALGAPVSNLNFDAADFDVAQDSDGTATVTLAGGGSGATLIATHDLSSGSPTEIETTDLGGYSTIHLVMVNASRSGASAELIQLGDSGGYDITNLYRRALINAAQDTISTGDGFFGGANLDTSAVFWTASIFNFNIAAPSLHRGDEQYSAGCATMSGQSINAKAYDRLKVVLTSGQSWSAGTLYVIGQN